MVPLQPVLLSGGSGTRLWPLSREAYPKQFLPLVDDDTMLQATWRRVAGLADAAPIVVANEEHRFLVAEQLRQIGAPVPAILLEPVGRNTAPAIAAAALQAMGGGLDPLLLVLPSDHVVRDAAGFHAAVKEASIAAAAGALVTFGIVPDAPETGFGYLSQGELYKEHQGIPLYHVEKFIEKPNLAKAMEFLAKGCYFWNSGIFIWRADLIRRLIAEHLPVLAAGLEKIEKAIGTPTFPQLLKNVYEGLPKISIDYGVMEKTRGVLMAVGDFFGNA